MTTETTPSATTARTHRLLLWLVLIITLVGVVTRFIAWEKVEYYFFDEAYYLKFAEFHASKPLIAFAGFVEDFTKHQEDASVGIPPPTRLVYPYAGALLHNASGMSMGHSLTAISAAATSLMLILAAIWSWRMFSPGISASVSALMAVSLNQLHLSQRIMIDPVFGVITLAALWSLWELGNNSRHRRWFGLLYVFAMGALVLVKENAFFVFVAMGLLLVSRKYTKVLPELPPNMLLVTVGTGAISFCALVFLSGGFEQFFKLYRLLVERSLVTPYASIFCDGPWYRYLVDSLLAQPLPTILAIAAIFWLPFENARVRYLCIFAFITFAIMSQVKGGMCYRFAIIWDFPLAVLAAFQIQKISRRLKPCRAVLVQTALVAVICASQIQNFWKIGVAGKRYALTTYDLVTALKMYNPTEGTPQP